MTLYQLIAQGKIDSVKQVVREHPSLVGTSDSNGDHPLHVAVRHKRTKIVDFLILVGADVNCRGEQGNTPLHFAVLANSKSLVVSLLRNGADPRQMNDAGVTPLYLAASTANAPIVSAIRKNTDFIDLNSLIYLDGPDVVLERLKRGVDNLSTDAQKSNLLWDAIRVQSIPLVVYLLQQGVDPNHKVHGTYPLLDAVSHKNADLVSSLLNGGASVSIVDHVGRTPLQFAGTYGASPEVKALLSAAGAQ